MALQLVHQKMKSISYLLNLVWPCDLLWLTECSRSNTMHVLGPQSQKALQPPASLSWKHELDYWSDERPCREGGQMTARTKAPGHLRLPRPGGAANWPQPTHKIVRNNKWMLYYATKIWSGLLYSRDNWYRALKFFLFGLPVFHMCEVDAKWRSKWFSYSENKHSTNPCFLSFALQPSAPNIFKPWIFLGKAERGSYLTQQPILLFPT